MDKKEELDLIDQLLINVFGFKPISEMPKVEEKPESLEKKIMELNEQTIKTLYDKNKQIEEMFVALGKELEETKEELKCKEDQIEKLQNRIAALDNKVGEYEETIGHIATLELRAIEALDEIGNSGFKCRESRLYNVGLRNAFALVLDKLRRI